MRRMKRPPGLWVLLSAGVLWLSLQDAYGIRASSLIFGKSTTTTTTTVAPQQNDTSPASDEESAATTDAPTGEGGNATKPTLTGNPQIDYVWDPNLPKELNGYNLSDYPFYERVPEDIDFKCDGLHDGFYASVKHKCQVYHHCLFGVRYDFLCANYTAFDQTLFNCNFVSNVDCQGSKKFWHRNDELYKEKSTTTQPPPVYNFYTPPPAPEGYVLAAQPQGAVPQRAPPPQVAPQVVPQQAPVLVPAQYPLPVDRRRSRPIAAPRRRQQYDYYDEEDYEERPRMNRRKRPRRPIYYDDYDEDYEEERYDRRGGNRRRRPYDRRPVRRNKDRRTKYDYDDDRLEDEDDEFILEKKAKNKRRKFLYDYDEEEEDRSEKRRPQSRREEKPYRTKPKRPLDLEEYDDYEDRIDKRKFKDEKRRDLEAETSRFKKHPRLGVRRPPSEEHEDDLQQSEPKSERSRKSNREGSYKRPPESESGRAVVKPVSGTLYDRPRLAPKINLPVPKNVADKYSYTAMTSKGGKNKEVNVPTEAPATTTTSTEKPVDAESAESSTRGFKRTKPDTSREVLKSVRKRIKEEQTTSTTSSVSYSERMSPIIRKFKRPFLPSRGGNPYSGRSLEPIGEKAVKPVTEETIVQDDRIVAAEDDDYYDDIQVKRPSSVRSKDTLDDNAEKTGPIRIKVPIRVKMTSEAPIATTSTTTESNKVNEADLLDENYDVTINEALSPIIPNLPIRAFPTGFGGDFRQKTTKYVILDPLTAGGPYYVK
ncbi:unnamed protein product [Callosobruchus maculatus]|uniref:Chitin-binding type-2 domain-containing protein n=2 Tax=Callosobruchus maculatus TaxID=64391 RepID=A0A653DLH3_CALMS|nr:unnamed protein product [Callosobruchus maculatus]